MSRPTPSGKIGPDTVHGRVFRHVFGLYLVADLLAAGAAANPAAEAERIAQMTVSEEAILEVMPLLKPLARSVASGALPGASAASLFADPLVVETLDRPIGSAGTGELSIPWIAERAVAPAPGQGALAPGHLDVWQTVFSTAGSLETSSFVITSGQLERRDDSAILVAATAFSGLLRLDDGSLRALSSEIVTEWAKADGRWQIRRWLQGPMKITDSAHPLFREVLDEVVPDPVTRAHARVSHHEKNLIDLFTKNSFKVTKPLYARFKDLDSSAQHPALSVVDIDRDGWDDLYVMGRWGKNQLLRNRGDGTMEDVAPKLGLDIDGLCNAACFADFDNDGDDDVFVGRSLERSLYLRNDNGRFVDATAAALGPIPLPYLVSTVSAADYDGDGLLDVYLGLYGPTERDGTLEEWGSAFLPKPMVEEMVKRSAGSHRYLNLIGPPNLLLRNTGDGTFGIPPEAEALAGWHNTHAGCWSDFDADGDVDLYVCNDFAPDYLYRQDVDSATGARRFVEVSEEMAGSAMQGFGMGASWGDYDRDGDLDLYVSNMYSKAGKRITAVIDGLDARVPYSAAGNLLFRNDGKTFAQVAGVGADDIAVAKAGWAYGAQWVDVDNDGWLDAYSANGFFTAPEPIRTDRDL